MKERRQEQRGQKDKNKGRDVRKKTKGGTIEMRQEEDNREEDNVG